MPGIISIDQRSPISRDAKKRLNTRRNGFKNKAETMGDSKVYTSNQWVRQLKAKSCDVIAPKLGISQTPVIDMESNGGWWLIVKNTEYSTVDEPPLYMLKELIWGIQKAAIATLSSQPGGRGYRLHVSGQSNYRISSRSFNSGWWGLHLMPRAKVVRGWSCSFDIIYIDRRGLHPSKIRIDPVAQVKREQKEACNDGKIVRNCEWCPRWCL